MRLENPKLLTLEMAEAGRAKLGVAGRKLVLTNGVFDLLHTGHLFYLQQARRLGDALYVAINSDQSVRALKGPSRPVMSEEQRAYALGALWFVDGIVIFREQRLVAEIRALRPDVYCKAGDYTLETLNPEERAELEKVGAKIELLPFLPGFSTTNLIAKLRLAGEG
jgi:rfaE bifunctional protein nucleotidyltransferase chain/domain